jgi:hypothetical protein
LIVSTPHIENNTTSANASKWYARWWGELLIALAITLFFARTFALSMFGQLPTDGSDIYENVWLYWHWQHSLFDSLSNPYFTDFIYYPTGTPLYLHSNQPLVALQALLLQPIFGQILGINLVILTALTLATWWAQRLFLYVSNYRPGAWAGALIFVWCNPWLWDYFTSGQINLISLQWVPLYVLCLLKAFDTTQGKPQWLFSGAAAACLLASSLTDFYYTLQLIILTVLATLFYLVARAKSWQARGWIVAKAAAIGAIWGILISPLLLNMLSQANNRLWYVPSQSQTVLRSVDLLSFFIPNGHNPIYGGLVSTAVPTALYTSYNPSGVTGSFNPGYVPLALALLAVIAGWRTKKLHFGLWLFIATVFAVLALGPQLHFNGQVLDDPKLPYWYLYNLPGLNVSRDPSNFSISYILAIAALASLGLRQLSAWAARRWTRPLPLGGKLLQPYTLLSAILLSLIAAEFATIPVEMSIDSVPAFYRDTLAADQDDYAILEVPSYVQDGGLEHLRMYFQTFHHKKLVGGQLARDHKRLNPTDFLSHSSLISEALVNDTAIPPTTTDMLQRPSYPEMSAAVLNYFNFRYIVVYPNAIKPDQQDNLKSFLARALGPNPQPVYQDNTIVAYRVPTATTNPPQVLADVGQGWFKPDTKDGQTWRYALFGYSNEVYLMNLTKNPLKVRLNFTAFSYAAPRSIRLTLNYERDIATYQLPASQPNQPHQDKNLSLEVELKPGSNLLTFFTFEQPVIPANLSADPDRRKLTFGIQNFTVTPG